MHPDKIKEFIEDNYPELVSKNRKNPDGWSFFFKSIENGNRSTRIMRAIRSSNGAPTKLKLAVSSRRPNKEVEFDFTGNEAKLKKYVDLEIQLLKEKIYKLETGLQ